jgi:DNA-binding NarL/FixJ family response regulator
MVSKAGDAPNKALHTTPENVAKIGNYKHLFRVASAYWPRGARVSFNVGPPQHRLYYVIEQFAFYLNRSSCLKSSVLSYKEIIRRMSMVDTIFSEDVRDRPTFTIRCGIPAIERIITNALEPTGFQWSACASVLVLVDAPYGFALRQLLYLDQTDLQVIVATFNHCPEYWEDVWDLHPAVLLVSDCLHREVEYAIVQAANGKHYRLTPDIKTQLTPTERRVLHYLARDWSNKCIAAQLNMKPQSVANVLNNVYGKLGVRGKVGAAFYYWGRQDLLG